MIEKISGTISLGTELLNNEKPEKGTINYSSDISNVNAGLIILAVIFFKMKLFNIRP